jgi:hypothetical protein
MQDDERFLMRIGQNLGLKAGLVVSWFYVTLIIGWLIYQTAQLPTALNRNLVTFGISLGFMLISGIVIGMLPAAIIGALTGRYLALLVARLYARLSPDRATLLGVLMCSGIALAGSGLFWLGASLLAWSPSTPLVSFAFTYAFFLGVPSILYVAIGGWGGARLYTLRSRPTAGQNAPSRR